MPLDEERFHMREMIEGMKEWQTTRRTMDVLIRLERLMRYLLDLVQPINVKHKIATYYLPQPR